MKRIIISIISIALVSVPLPIVKEPPLPSSVTLNEQMKPVEYAELAVTPTAPEAIPKVIIKVKPTIVKSVPKQSGTCNDWMTQAGIVDQDSAYALIMRESGCNPHATNASSGAYGIPQSLPGSKMASMGSDWQTNPVTQLRWMASYTLSRYGSFAAALQHSYNVGWY